MASVEPLTSAMIMYQSLGTASRLLASTDGAFFFRDILRPGETAYVGQNGTITVNFTPSDGHVVVYSTETGEEFYNYYIDPVEL